MCVQAELKLSVASTQKLQKKVKHLERGVCAQATRSRERHLLECGFKTWYALTCKLALNLRPYPLVFGVWMRTCDDSLRANDG